MVAADLALIGGGAKQRLTYAIELRRKGLSVFTEFVDRKRAKMFTKAVEETGDAKKVLDLSKDDDKARLTNLLVDDFRIETKRVLVFKDREARSQNDG